MRRHNPPPAASPDMAVAAELLARAQVAEDQRDTARAALVAARDKASAKCRASSEALTRALRGGLGGGSAAFWQAAYDRDVAVWSTLDRLAKR